MRCLASRAQADTPAPPKTATKLGSVKKPPHVPFLTFKTPGTAKPHNCLGAFRVLGPRRSATRGFLNWCAESAGPTHRQDRASRANCEHRMYQTSRANAQDRAGRSQGSILAQNRSPRRVHQMGPYHNQPRRTSTNLGPRFNSRPPLPRRRVPPRFGLGALDC